MDVLISFFSQDTVILFDLGVVGLLSRIVMARRHGKLLFFTFFLGGFLEKSY